MLIQYLVGRGTMDDGIISGIHRKQTTLKSTVGEQAIERSSEQSSGRSSERSSAERRSLLRPFGPRPSSLSLVAFFSDTRSLAKEEPTGIHSSNAEERGSAFAAELG